MIDFIEATLRGAGKIVSNSFGRSHQSSRKGDISNVVTQTDFASEKYIVNQIKSIFPKDTIIAEETGFAAGSTEYCWIIDPIDGTSNFAAAIPWFGIIIARLKNWQPIAAGIYLPIQNEMYTATKGNGAWLNKKQIKASSEKDLKNLLISYGINFSNDESKIDQELKIIKKIIQNSRNLRSTNSVLDYCYVASGKLGAYINQTSNIWDNAGPYLIVTEAGGQHTDIKGKPLNFKCTKDNYDRNFTYICSSTEVFSSILKLVI